MLDDPESKIEMMREMLISHVPHAKAIGLEVVSAGQGRCRMKVPYSKKLVGNPDTGVVHGGVITSLLDNACGVATQLALPEPTSIATLDLRIDYMRPATPELDIIGETHCYKVTKSVAFVRGTAFHETPDEPIATCVAAFMLAANRAVSPSSIARTEWEEAQRGGDGGNG